MFGIDFSRSRNEAASERRLQLVLDRRTQVDALSSLIGAMRPNPTQIKLNDTAFGLDSSVFLRLGTHSKTADVADYLTSNHTAPLILPGQAIQEFWNNQFQAIQSLAKSIKGQFDSIKDNVERIDEQFGLYAVEFTELIDRFSSDFGHVYDDSTSRKVHSLMETLQKKAIVSFASRAKFCSIAEQRKKTKTPPGFKDDGDGDFYIWIDFLCGLQQARAKGIYFNRVVLVTNDKKKDWSRESVAHPILSSEVMALLDVPFETWDLDRLVKEITAQV